MGFNVCGDGDDEDERNISRCHVLQYFHLIVYGYDVCANAVGGGARTNVDPTLKPRGVWEKNGIL